MAASVTSRLAQDTLAPPPLSLAFALGQETWQLGFTLDVAQAPRERPSPARDSPRGRQASAQAKRRVGLPEDARVVRCYAAGRDGLGLHRCLVAHGVENYGIAAARMEGKRRPRRAQTERLEVRKLRTMRRRQRAGERKGWRVVHVPSVEEEDRRPLHRALTTVQQDRPRLRNRRQGL